MQLKTAIHLQFMWCIFHLVYFTISIKLTLAIVLSISCEVELIALRGFSPLDTVAKITEQIIEL